MRDPDHAVLDAPTSRQVAHRPVRSLLFSTLYPSAARPQHGVFVETRLRKLLAGGEVETKVIAPVPWFFSRHTRFGAYATYARTPAAERRHNIDVQHPRYALLPKVGMSMAPFTLAAAALPAARELIRSGFDFDLIDAHYLYPDGVAAALLGRKLGRPVIMTARGSDLTELNHYRVPLRLMQWATRRAFACAGVCNALVDVLREWQLPERKLHVLRNGVELDRFRPVDQAAARASLGLGGAPLLLSVGHLIERKGHHLIIDALAILRRDHADACLVIVGDGPMRSSLQSQAARLGVADGVVFAGVVPNGELSPWYSAADLLVLASSREGWANVILEAMACGTPVVATPAGGSPEVVASPVAGMLIERRDPEAIADAVRRTFAARLDRAAVRAYAEGFSWDSTTAAQAALFREAARWRGMPGGVR